MHTKLFYAHILIIFVIDSNINCIKYINKIVISVTVSQNMWKDIANRFNLLSSLKVAMKAQFLVMMFLIACMESSVSGFHMKITLSLKTVRK